MSTSDRREKDDDRRQRARAEQNPEDPLHLKRTTALRHATRGEADATAGSGCAAGVRPCLRLRVERVQ